MPSRKHPLVNGETYHILNKGIAGIPTFLNKRDFQRALKIIKFYRFNDPPLKLSRFLILKEGDKKDILTKLSKRKKLVEILAYCLMPNHFHFLLKQISDEGISHFLSLFQNSYTRYFNIKHDRYGQLFLDQFKSVWIEDDNKLTHVSRYIHLNPYTSFLVKNAEGLEDYPWSSLSEYINADNTGFCTTEIIIKLFKKALNYKKFVLDQKDYQKKLNIIKHLVIED